MWERYFSVANLEEAVEILAEQRQKARIIAGATDLMLELERGNRRDVSILVDVSRIQSGRQIAERDGCLFLGPLVTHNDCVESALIHQFAYPLARAAWEVGSPQIRNRGTVVGNLVTASPANDTIPALMALDASIILRSIKGERIVNLHDFYLGVRKTVMQPEELVAGVLIPKMTANQRGQFIKYALRNAQAISVVNVAVILGLTTDEIVESAKITLGAVAPTIVHAVQAENFLLGQALTENTIRQAGELVAADIRPIDDLRSSAHYRKAMAGVITRRAIVAIRDHGVGQGMPEHPVLLRKSGTDPIVGAKVEHNRAVDIVTEINGKAYVFHGGQNKSLLRLLREEGFLIGTKEGCAEGECGACTVHLDGAAVMSCMVPAPRAHGAVIRTVEGLAQNGTLHPIQKAFIQEGAVQCGYCTPGFLMSGAMLLEEQAEPGPSEIRQAFTGNLCRCTGYYKIIQAVETAVKNGVGT